MEEILTHLSHPKPFFRSPTALRPHLSRRRSVAVHRPDAAPLSLPNRPSRAPPPPPHHHHDSDEPQSRFREKMLFLESRGMDLFALTSAHPPIVAVSLEDILSTLDFLESMGFTPIELRRICGMCPEVLASSSRQLLPVFTFLLREARVQGMDIWRIINRRPRLLVSNVEARLRPTLYFLQMLGITDTAKHATLLTCSVEGKLVPRIQYLEGAGFSPKDARSMVRRFPQLLCYSIALNLEPKFDFFVMEMGRDHKELKLFPRYFSFSLHERIIPRHQICKEKGVLFALPALLKPADEVFMARVEACRSSSPPLRSPFWHQITDDGS